MARKRESVRLEGLENLEAALKRLSEDTQGEALRDAARAGAEITRSVASQLAPRDSGLLAEKVQAEVQFTRTQDKAEVHVGIHKDAFYGWFQETGTQFAPAQPFLRPALEATKDDVIDEMRDHLAASILSGIR